MGKKSQEGGNQSQKNFQPEYKKQTKDKQAASLQPTVVSVYQEPQSTLAEPQATVVSDISVGAQTLQQQRAKYALEQVKAALDGGVNPKEFRSYAASFPAMIQMNGLGQTAAFYFSQGGTYGLLYKILSDWLRREKQPYFGNADLLAGITGKDMHSYRIAQAEALLLLDWVKRFAKAFVRED